MKTPGSSTRSAPATGPLAANGRERPDNAGTGAQNNEANQAGRAERVAWLNQQLAELCAACPWTRTNPDECPLHDVRTKTPAEIAQWLEGLTPTDKEYLILYHQCCLVVRWEDRGGLIRRHARPRTSP